METKQSCGINSAFPLPAEAGVPAAAALIDEADIDSGQKAISVRTKGGTISTLILRAVPTRKAILLLEGLGKGQLFCVLEASLPEGLDPAWIDRLDMQSLMEANDVAMALAYGADLQKKTAARLAEALVPKNPASDPSLPPRPRSSEAGLMPQNCDSGPSRS